MNTNPLARHFRQPAMYITLPSQGRFYPDGTVDYPESGEIPVFPMTALDEISYRTPDALFNGNATVDVIKSCVPNIKDPWQMPNTDFDTVLIGIRIASNGEKMDIATVCPHCQTESEFEVDLIQLLGRIQPVDYSTPVVLGDLEIYLKPLSYKRVFDNQITQFEEQQKIQQFSQNPSQESVDLLANTLKNLNSLAIASLVESIHYIKDGDTIVAEKGFIDEYVRNAPKESFNAISAKLGQIREKNEIPPFEVTCTNEECQKTFTAPFTMDSANFFGQDS